MKPSGNLVEILDFERSPEFYSSKYKQSSGRKFEKEKIEEEIREELKKFGIPEVGSDNPAVDNAPELARILYYFIPEYDRSAVSNRDASEQDVETLTPTKAAELAYWYIQRLNERPETVKPLENELVNRFMRYVDFRIKRQAYENAISESTTRIPYLNEEFKIEKRGYEDLEEMKERALQLRDEIQDMKKHLKNLKEGNVDESSSLFNRVAGWLKGDQSAKQETKLKRNIHRKQKEFRALRTILEFPSRYSEMREWVIKRSGAYEDAVQHDEFKRACEKIAREKEESSGLSEMDFNEFRSLLEGAVQVVSPSDESESGEEDESESSRETDEKQQGSKAPSFPPYLQLKESYSQDDIQEVFRAINSDELDLGDRVPKIRTMLMSGNAREAIEEIRNIISSDR